VKPSSQTQPPKRRGGRRAEPLDARILKKTDRSGDCWLWTGYLDRDGYAIITVAERVMRAHRVSYATFVGEIGEGMEIDHLCRVRHCVRPEHLEPVSHRENVLRQLEATGSIGGQRPNSLVTDGVCVAGHVMDEENTYSNGGRLYCRACHRERNRRHAAAKRAAARKEAAR
jgi:hypothetical protein